MKELIIYSDGSVIQVCDEDLMFLLGHSLSSNGKYIFAFKPGWAKPKGVHVLVAERMGLDCSNDIDHKDRNKLNNQRSNLRPATRSQNLANSGLAANSSSGSKGVSFHKASNRWRASFCYTHLGLFNTKEEASRAYEAAAKLHFGEFARTQ
jgi:hypothetical protein